MNMTPRYNLALGVLAVAAVPLACGPAAAQSIGYGNVAGGSGAAASGAGWSGGDAPAADGQEASGDSASAPRRSRGRSRFTPYIEATQLVTLESAPNDEVLTYSQLAAGADAALYGVNTEATMSVRYQRSFGWNRQASDSDFLSGVARGSMRLGNGFSIDAGGLAARTSFERTGAAVQGALGRGDTAAQVYSVYAGPSVAGEVGDVNVSAGYQIGYSRTDEPNSRVSAPDQRSTDYFDDSVTHMASIHAGVRPHEVLPVGLGAGTTYYREDISNLDQRVEDLAARADVTVPVGQDIALVGGVGYERVRVSSRDALRDSAGIPVVGGNGQYKTDKASPRILAYDTSGLIWDVGVMWRPSRRTALEAHVGRRYGSTSVYGSFGYAPNSQTTISLSVYDNVAGFGGGLMRSLSGLPTSFNTIRNPLTGDLAGCVSAIEPEASGSGTCLNSALGSIRSSAFRGRGVMASYNLDLGRISAGVGAGYDRRKFIGAPGTVLALYNGVVDENIWLSGNMSGQLGERSFFSAAVYANWFQSGSGLDGDGSAIGATASYNRNLTNHLTAIAALSLDGVNREAPLDDYWIASALMGVRYSF